MIYPKKQYLSIWNHVVIQQLQWFGASVKGFTSDLCHDPIHVSHHVLFLCSFLEHVTKLVMLAHFVILYGENRFSSSFLLSEESSGT